MKGIAKIFDFLPMQKEAKPMWPAGAHPHARVKEEAKDEELPQDPRKGAQIRLADRDADGSKPKVKVDKREAQEARAKQQKDQLTRKSEQFAEGRQSSDEDSKRRAKLAEHFPKVKSQRRRICRSRLSRRAFTFHIQSARIRPRRRARLPHRDRKHHLDHHRRPFAQK